jgi:hypothetical protein
MILTQQPIPKTIEELGHEVSEDALLARLELQRAAQVCNCSCCCCCAAVLCGFVALLSCVCKPQEDAIRNYKADTIVVGAPKPEPSESEGTEDDGACSCMLVHDAPTDSSSSRHHVL